MVSTTVSIKPVRWLGMRDNADITSKPIVPLVYYSGKSYSFAVADMARRTQEAYESDQLFWEEFSKQYDGLTYDI